MRRGRSQGPPHSPDVCCQHDAGRRRTAGPREVRSWHRAQAVADPTPREVGLHGAQRKHDPDVTVAAAAAAPLRELYDRQHAEAFRRDEAAPVGIEKLEGQAEGLPRDAVVLGIERRRPQHRHDAGRWEAAQCRMGGEGVRGKLNTLSESQRTEAEGVLDSLDNWHR